MAQASFPPVPHGTPENPMATDGFEFVEYTAPDVADLDRLFAAMGFRPVARHRSKSVTLYRQGGVNFIVNGEPHSFAQAFARVHRPPFCAIAFRRKDAAALPGAAVAPGAQPFSGTVRPEEPNNPAP